MSKIKYFHGFVRNMGRPLSSIFSLVDYKSHIDRQAKINRFVKIINSYIDKYSYIGPNSTIVNSDVGKYCSISWNCYIGLASHGVNHISTSPIFLFKKNGTGSKLVDFDIGVEVPERTYLGSDVWVGAGVVILEGVRVGDGAVIGTGAVVTKDVPAYAIVGGIPAKLIRYRFPEDIIKVLIKSKWWNCSEDEMKKNINFFQKSNIDINDALKLIRVLKIE